MRISPRLKLLFQTGAGSYSLLSGQLVDLVGGCNVLIRKPSRIEKSNLVCAHSAGGNREVVGHARIKEIDMKPVDKVRSKYETKLLLSKDELDNYVGTGKQSECSH